MVSTWPSWHLELTIDIKKTHKYFSKKLCGNQLINDCFHHYTWLSNIGKKTKRLPSSKKAKQEETQTSKMQPLQSKTVRIRTSDPQKKTMTTKLITVVTLYSGRIFKVNGVTNILLFCKNLNFLLLNGLIKRCS